MAHVNVKLSFPECIFKTVRIVFKWLREAVGALFLRKGGERFAIADKRGKTVLKVQQRARIEGVRAFFILYTSG